MDILIVVPPGFETLAAAELNEKFPDLSCVPIRGGLELNISADRVPDLHYRLKIPTSMRERLYEFKCRDFPKLFNKIQSLPWRDHLVGDAFELSISAEKSRLGNEKRITETVSDGIHRFFSKQPPKKPVTPYTHKIYVRMSSDICTISRDLTGTPLFQRGYKELSAIAPLRENLAAGLFYGLWRESGGFDVLFDPMCGSGTFLFEAWLFWHDVRRMARDFAFLHDERWRNSRKVEHFADQPHDTRSRETARPTKFFGFDRDERTLEAARVSAANVIAKNPTAAPKSPWIFSVGDVFSKDFPKLSTELVNDSTRSIACIVNPPYGERISLPMPPDQYYPKLLDRLTQICGPSATAIGVVVPKSHSRYVQKKFGKFSRVRTLDFQNGGLDVQFQIFARLNDDGSN